MKIDGSTFFIGCYRYDNNINIAINFIYCFYQKIKKGTNFVLFWLSKYYGYAIIYILVFFVEIIQYIGIARFAMFSFMNFLVLN